MVLFLILLIIAIFLEGSVISLPLVLVFLLCLAIWKRDGIAFPIAFAAGLLLDILVVRTIGMSSLFFVVFVFLIFLYQRKYEINSYPFVAFAAFFGSIVFLLIFGYRGWFWQSLISSLIASILFMILRSRSLPQKFSI